MKILLYSKHQKLVEKSGVGRALEHQRRALESAGIEYTMDEHDEFDIVHINTIFPGALFMAKRASSQNRKVVFHAHSTMEDFRNSFTCSNLAAPLFKKWITYCYSHGDIILTPTSYSKQIIEKYDLNNQIVAVSNGIDLTEFKRDEEAGRTFREKFGFGKEDKIIMSAGLYIERKGILDFVELARQMPEYKFLWCGHTDLKTVPRKIREAVKTKLPNLYFPGYIKKEEMKGVYSGCDLFIFLSHEETEGIVLLEAMAMKIPVLIRDIPIYDNWIKEGSHAYKDKTNDGFEKKIKSIITGSHTDLTDNAYTLAQERNIQNIGLMLKQIYSSLR